MNVTFRPLNVEFDWKWVTEQIPLNLVAGTNGIVAIDADTNTRIAAMICENWTPTSLEGHYIVTNRAALKHGFHIECAEYLFTTADRIKAFARIPVDNKASISLCKHFGFKELITLKDVFGIGEDMVVMELNRDECPYWTEIGEEHGQEQQHAAAAGL